MENNMRTLSDEEIRAYASKQKLNRSREYDYMVKTQIDKCLQEKKKEIVRIPRVAIAMITVLLILIGSGGVYAAVNYVYERMQQMSEEEKQGLVSELQGAEANCDTYSREYTEEELVRIEELKIAYSNGTFPEGEIVRISSETEIDEEHICFMASTSMFYLPDVLTDEEILRLIDFLQKRDYSLNEEVGDILEEQKEESAKEQFELQKRGKVTEEEAIALATAKLEMLFDVKFSEENFDEILYNVEESGLLDGAVCYRVGKVRYVSGVDMDTGLVRYASRRDFGAADVDYAYVTEAEIREKLDVVRACAKDFLGENIEWEKGHAYYWVSEDGGVMRRTVQYYLHYEDITFHLEYDFGEGNDLDYGLWQGEEEFLWDLEVRRSWCENMLGGMKEREINLLDE